MVNTKHSKEKKARNLVEIYDGFLFSPQENELHHYYISKDWTFNYFFTSVYFLNDSESLLNCTNAIKRLKSKCNMNLFPNTKYESLNESANYRECFRINKYLTILYLNYTSLHNLAIT